MKTENKRDNSGKPFIECPGHHKHMISSGKLVLGSKIPQGFWMNGCDLDKDF